MKLLYVTDLHGSPWKYERLEMSVRRAGSSVVINGGDMLPKLGGLWRQARYIEGDLRAHFERMTAMGSRYLCCLGNDDLRCYDELFDRACRSVEGVWNLSQRLVEIDGYEFIGMNWVVDYPFQLKDRCRMDTAAYQFGEQYGIGLLSTSEGWRELPDWPGYARTLPTIAEELERLVKPDKPRRAVYIMHMPPAGLGLDVIHPGDRVGSEAIYRFIEERQPRLTLHGHIHESPLTSGVWAARLDQSWCVQPGQLSPFTYVEIDLDAMELIRVEETRDGHRTVQRTGERT